LCHDGARDAQLAALRLQIADDARHHTDRSGPRLDQRTRPLAGIIAQPGDGRARSLSLALSLAGRACLAVGLGRGWRCIWCGHGRGTAARHAGTPLFLLLYTEVSRHTERWRKEAPAGSLARARRRRQWNGV